MAVRTTSNGIVIYNSGDPATIIAKGMATGDSVDAAVSRGKAAADRALAAAVTAEASADAAADSATQAQIVVGSAADNAQVDAAIASVVATASDAQSKVDALVGVDGKVLPAKVPDLAASYTARALFMDAVAEGAPFDGVTNAQPAIGSAIGKLPTAGGRLLLRRGSYLLNTRIITTKQGLVVQGEGMDATVLLLAAAGFQVGCSDVTVRDLTIKGNGSNARQLFQLVATGAFKNWRFERVKFDGVGVTPGRLGSVDFNNVALTSASGLDSHIEFDRCIFTNYTEDGCLYSKGTHFVDVNRCQFYNLGTDSNKGDALKFSYGATEWRAVGCDFELCKRDAIDCYDGQRGLIEGCNIISPGVHGIEMKVTKLTAPNLADRIRVVNNHIVGAGSAVAAPAIQCATSLTKISGNLIEGGTSYGIRGGKTTDGSANNKDLDISHNTVIGPAGQGIVLTGIDGAVVMGNIVKGSLSRNYEISNTLNSGIVGSASLNRSVGGAVADTWP